MCHMFFMHCLIKLKLHSVEPRHRLMRFLFTSGHEVMEKVQGSQWYCLLSLLVAIEVWRCHGSMCQLAVKGLSKLEPFGSWRQHNEHNFWAGAFLYPHRVSNRVSGKSFQWAPATWHQGSPPISHVQDVYLQWCCNGAVHSVLFSEVLF